MSALVYDELVIEESRGGVVDEEAAARLLAAKAVEAGIERFVDRAELDEFLARVEFAAEHSAIAALAGKAMWWRRWRRLCYGLRRFSEVEKAAGGLIAALERRLDAALLERVAPARLKLPSGRMTKVRYERGKPPWVASRLQDFFGMMESPRVAWRQGAAGGAFAGAESEAGADDDGSGGVLGAVVSAVAAGVGEAVSAACVAGESGCDGEIMEKGFYEAVLCGSGVVGGGFSLPAERGHDCLSASDEGWYNSDGIHHSLNKNYAVGDAFGLEYRNYFVFDLTGISGQVVSAQLRVPNPQNGYFSPNAEETYQVRSVGTPIGTLESDATDGAGIFAGLGMNVLYGSQQVSQSDNGHAVSISLNAEAVGAIEYAQGFFALGGGLAGLPAVAAANRVVFGGSSGPPEEIPQLILTTAVPEPATVPLWSTVVLSCFFLQRVRARD